MKARFPILLLTCWVLTQVFIFTALWLGRIRCQNEFEADASHLSSSHVLTLHLRSMSEVRWERPLKEFELNGKLFDVVSYSVEDDGVWISCVSDKKEDALLALMEKGHQNKHKNDLPFLLKLAWTKFLPDALYMEFTASDESISAATGDVSFFLKDAFEWTYSPPPDLRFC